MKYLLFFSLFVVWACQTPKTSIPSSSLPALDSAFVASHTHYFQLSPEEFTGEGAQTLEQAVRAAQILILGEIHGFPTLSRFVEQLAPLLRANGFRHLACEIGPHSAQYLEQLTKVPETVPANLAAFYEQYQFEAIGDVPMPFFELQ